LPFSTLFPYTTLFRSHRSGNSVSKTALRGRLQSSHLRPPESEPLALLAAGLDDVVPILECLFDPKTPASALSGPSLSTDSLGRIDRKSTRLNSSHEWI